MNNLFYHLISVIVGLIFTLVGIVAMSLPWAAGVRSSVIELILEYPMLIFFLGLVLGIAGAAVLAYQLVNIKRHTHYLRKGRMAIGVEHEIIDGYISRYLATAFPNQDAGHQLLLRKNKLIVTVDMPSYPRPEQEPVTEKIFDDLSALLSEKIGYHQDLHLSVSFLAQEVKA